MSVTRRVFLGLVVAATTPVTALAQPRSNTMLEILKASQSDKKSVMLFVRGQSIGGAVSVIGSDTIELRNREYSRVVIRIDSIDAVAVS